MGLRRTHSLKEEEERLKSPPSPSLSDEDNAEERRGLLSGKSAPHSKDSDQDKPRSRRRVIVIVAFFALLLLSAAILPPWIGRRTTRKGEVSEKAILLSNGTHDYERTVLLISIDGMRSDYLDRGFTPHLFDISQVGLRAKWMRPSFPTLTFPNHWTLMTGLYPGSHGIVANNFWDPIAKAEFMYSDPQRSWNGTWWGGEPLWATASKAGLKTANMMWPGPPLTKDGYKPDYFDQFAEPVSLSSKLQRIIEWLELPRKDRPRLITMYEPTVDEAGHNFGPDAPQVAKALKEVDAFARDLRDALRSRNLDHIVDVIFVSDHGMADTHNNRLVYLDNILGEDGVEAIEHQDGWPSAGLRFRHGTNTSHYLQLLLDFERQRPETISVYTQDTMPARFHFTGNHRIAPIYVVPKMGWAITNHHEHMVVMQGDYTPKGNHGYDNAESTMFASFIADGPFAQHLKRRQNPGTEVERTVKSIDQGVLKRILSSVVGATIKSESPQLHHKVALSHPSTKPLVIDGFNNVELYGLVVKMLGIEEHASPNDGTEGFWDKYFPGA